MMEIENWRTQIRKGYLELCILTLIESSWRLYGFEILDRMEKAELPLKEGTLYPLLNRMTQEGILSASWEMDQPKGHPRKFYSLTREGKKALAEMQKEFQRMTLVFLSLTKEKPHGTPTSKDRSLPR